MDNDGEGDPCDDDDDGDSVPDSLDECPYDPFPETNTGGDVISCTIRPESSWLLSRCEGDTEAVSLHANSSIDGDVDGVPSVRDNCEGTFNLRQEDKDADGVGDACDEDRDGDGVPDIEDTCIDIPNHDQSSPCD